MHTTLECFLKSLPSKHFLCLLHILKILYDGNLKTSSRQGCVRLLLSASGTSSDSAQWQWNFSEVRPWWEVSESVQILPSAEIEGAQQNLWALTRMSHDNETGPWTARRLPVWHGTSFRCSLTIAIYKKWQKRGPWKSLHHPSCTFQAPQLWVKTNFLIGVWRYDVSNMKWPNLKYSSGAPRGQAKLMPFTSLQKQVEPRRRKSTVLVLLYYLI